MKKRYECTYSGSGGNTLLVTDDLYELLDDLEAKLEFGPATISIMIQVLDEDIQRIREDGMINISEKLVQLELKELGYSGCMLDNDCSCSDQVHERDSAILHLYVKAHGTRT